MLALVSSLQLLLKLFNLQVVVLEQLLDRHRLRAAIPLHFVKRPVQIVESRIVSFFD